MKNVDKKLLIEWEKIKQYGIFESIDDFARIYLNNPNGACYKKYTNYPWSKENFFFGEYSELVNFYKTSTEVPFYLNEKIGEKHGQLTIKSFNIKFEKGKRVYYANCICDCGNECEKKYDKIVQGKCRTCGAHIKKDQKIC